jgi:hypothetical protein
MSFASPGNKIAGAAVISPLFSIQFCRRLLVRAVYDLAPVIADVISAHCPRTSARADFMRACFYRDWDEARSMVEGMLVEPRLLRGYQENRLREFLKLLPVRDTARAA